MAITKKREARKSVRQSGWITLDGGFAARPCTVLDLSSAGAKITVDDPKLYTKPFTVKVTEILLPDSDVVETICNENEKDRAHLK